MSIWPTMLVSIFFLTTCQDVRAQTTSSDLNRNAMDLLFLIDSTYYITESNFRVVLQSILNFIETLPVGPDTVNVAAISYGVATERTDFTGDMTILRDRIPKLRYDGQTSLTHIAFDVAAAAMTSQKSLRPNARKVVILVTESISVYPSKVGRALKN
uniref:VWFA domain-containing protein n=1 Tax=Arion vulgaris TaxID=1028688 RepID=A0A0B6ZRU1_9EUPU